MTKRPAQRARAGSTRGRPCLLGGRSGGSPRIMPSSKVSMSPSNGSVLLGWGTEGIAGAAMAVSLTCFRHVCHVLPLIALTVAIIFVGTYVPQPTPTPYVVREYPQQRGVGGVELVQQWSDGRF